MKNLSLAMFFYTSRMQQVPWDFVIKLLLTPLKCNGNFPQLHFSKKKKKSTYSWPLNATVFVLSTLSLCLLYFRSLDGKEITPEEFEKYKIIIESEDRDIEDGLKECTFSLTIPRCKFIINFVPSLDYNVRSLYLQRFSGERENGGKYTIKAKNKWGECESSADLTIILRPEIEGPDDVTAVPGEAVEFVCVVKANPVPEVTW